MSASHRFRVGKFECIVVADGSSDYGAEHLFVDAPEDQVRQALAEHGFGPDALEVPYTCLAVNVDGSWVLVDTGAGIREGARVGQAKQNLAKAGIDAADIQVVILTHGNTDHIGGLTDKEGKLKFGEARYVMGKREWDFWRNKEALIEMGGASIIPFMEQKLGSIADRVELVTGESEVLPGVRVLPAEGHTPGHMVVVFSSEGEELWSTGDVLIHPIHLEHLDWYTVFDMAPEEAIETKQRILNNVSGGALVHAYHFPFPGIGRVSKEGKIWSWQPVEMEK